MMSTVGATRAPDTTAAPALGDVWAPAGAVALVGHCDGDGLPRRASMRPGDAELHHVQQRPGVAAVGEDRQRIASDGAMLAMRKIVQRMLAAEAG